jgi:hypothetical protein
MFMFLIITLSVIAGLLVGTKAGVWLERRRNVLPKRKGVYTIELTGTGNLNKGQHYVCKALVTELEDMGNGFSKVKVNGISGLSGESDVEQAERIIGNVVSTDRVVWSDPMVPLLRE